MYALLGICLALATFLTFNALASGLATTIWRFAPRFTKNWKAATRARIIFVLRTFPAATALLLVSVFLIPSYLAFEPRQTVETVSVKLGILTLFSAIGIILAFWRGIATWRTTGKLVNNWLSHPKTVYLKNLPILAYRIEHKFPVVAVIGVLRPKLFVAGQVFDALAQEELRAVIVHETAHVAARDNLKRWLMRICRDFLVIIPSPSLLDKDWAEAVELAADEQAASHKIGATALDLAEAIIKIARLVPAGTRPAMPAGAFLIDGETETGDVLTRRVERLVQIACEKSDVDWRDFISRGFTWICFGLLFLTISFTAMNFDTLVAIHNGIERFVTFLS